jgi:hypothetical protein
MKHRILTLPALLCLLVANAFAQGIDTGPVRSTEDSLESNSESGTLYFNTCAGCNGQGLYLTKDSRYFVGNVQVTLDQLRQVIGGKQPRLLTIFHRPGDSAVTRIIVFAP